MSSHKNNTIYAAFASLGALMTAVYMYIIGSFNFNPIAPLFTILMAALVAKYFSQKAMERNLHPVAWLLLAPIFFALAGFGIWSGLVLSAQVLNNTVQAAPTVDFVELVSGIFTRGITFAQMGFLIGIAWALPTSLALQLWHTKETASQNALYQLKNGTFTKVA